MRQKLFILGGKNSRFINNLVSQLKNYSIFDIVVISIGNILNNQSKDLDLIDKNSFIIIGFSNKKNLNSNISKSLEALKKITNFLTYKKVSGNNIFIFGSESYLGPYSDYFPIINLNLLLRDIYAFDSYVRLKVLTNIFDRLNVIFLPGTKKNKSLIKLLIIYFIGLILGLEKKNNINVISLREISNLLENIILKKNIPKRLHYPIKIDSTSKFSLKRQLILQYFPKVFIKYAASIISYNLKETNFHYYKSEKENKKTTKPKKGTAAVTIVNRIDDDFYFTLSNLIQINNKFYLKWIICLKTNLVSKINKIVKKYNFVDLIIDDHSSKYEYINIFIKEYEKKLNYYIPLKKGHILFLNGLKSAIHRSGEKGALLIFGPYIGYKKIIFNSNSETEKFVYKNDNIFYNFSSNVLIKMDVHKIFGLYDVLEKTISDKKIYKKIADNKPQLIYYASDLIGYFPDKFD